MSSILDIPQIPSVDFTHIQNDLHIGFTGDLKKRLDKARWTDETKAHRESDPLCASTRRW